MKTLLGQDLTDVYLPVLSYTLLFVNNTESSFAQNSFHLMLRRASPAVSFGKKGPEQMSMQ
jgi:hypothetical protein